MKLERVVAPTNSTLLHFMARNKFYFTYLLTYLLICETWMWWFKETDEMRLLWRALCATEWTGSKTEPDIAAIVMRIKSKKTERRRESKTKITRPVSKMLRSVVLKTAGEVIFVWAYTKRCFVQGVNELGINVPRSCFGLEWRLQ